MAPQTGLRFPVHGKRIDPVYPYIDAEITWAVRREYAATAVDVIARRTRLSFLNSEAALEALPQVIDVMAKELNWDEAKKEQEFKDGTKFLASMGLSEARLGKLTLQDVRTGAHKIHLATDDDCMLTFPSCLILDSPADPVSCHRSLANCLQRRRTRHSQEAFH